MKNIMKVFSCLVVCMLSFMLFGLTACSLLDSIFGNSTDKVSDEVTAEEWSDAMSAEKALNVTMKSTYKRFSASEEKEIKTALTVNGNYITGKLYEYDNGEDSTNDNNYSYTNTLYEVYNTNSYSYVGKQTKSDEADSWTGEYVDSYKNCKDGSDIYETVIYYLTTYANRFANFEYIDGEYKYSESEDYSFSVKINDGYVTSVYEEGIYTYSIPGNKWSAGGYGTQNYTLEISFLNYGSTTVTVPDEYTYDNYTENHTS